MSKHSGAVAESPAEVEELQKRIETLEAQRVVDRRILENFLARFGTYYNSEGSGSLFIVDKLVQSGANGLALTSQQGPIELFALPMKLEKSSTAKEAYWVPALLPEQTKDAIEEFGAESNGPDNKASA